MAKRRMETLAFIAALVVSVVDSLGLSFTNPLQIPYGKYLGASAELIAWTSAIRGLCSMVAKVWMPWLSDVSSRTTVVRISVIGSTVSYFIQGLAAVFPTPQSRIACYIAGRAVNGLFDGTAPVLRSYISEVFQDEDVMKQKLIYLNLSSLSIGMVFSPLAGIVAGWFGLAAPFYTCCGVGLVGTAFSVMYFKEPLAKTPQEEDGNASPTSASSSGSVGQQTWRSSPWCDQTVLLTALYQLLAYMAVCGGLSFLIPLMMYEPSYNVGPFPDPAQTYTTGEMDELKEARGANIGFWTGTSSIPMGIFNVIVSTFFYVKITRGLGDMKALLIFGLTGTAITTCYGWWATRLWHIFVLQALEGCIFGIIAPAASPLMAKYARAHYPHHMAQVQAIPGLGKSLAAALGQPVVERIAKFYGIPVAWYVCSGFLLFATAAIVIIARRVSALPGKGRSEGRGTSSDSIVPETPAKSFLRANSVMHLNGHEDLADLPMTRWNQARKQRIRAIVAFRARQGPLTAIREVQLTSTSGQSPGHPPNDPPILEEEGA